MENSPATSVPKDYNAGARGFSYMDNRQRLLFSGGLLPKPLCLPSRPYPRHCTILCEHGTRTTEEKGVCSWHTSDYSVEFSYSCEFPRLLVMKTITLKHSRCHTLQLYHQIYAIGIQVIVSSRSYHFSLDLVFQRLRLAVLIIRTYALYGRSRRIATFQAVVALVALSVGIVRLHPQLYLNRPEKTPDFGLFNPPFLHVRY